MFEEHSLGLRGVNSIFKTKSDYTKDLLKREVLDVKIHSQDQISSVCTFKRGFDLNSVAIGAELELVAESFISHYIRTKFKDLKFYFKGMHSEIKDFAVVRVVCEKCSIYLDDLAVDFLIDTKSLMVVSNKNLMPKCLSLSEFNRLADELIAEEELKVKSEMFGGYSTLATKIAIESISSDLELIKKLELLVTKKKTVNRRKLSSFINCFFDKFEKSKNGFANFDFEIKVNVEMGFGFVKSKVKVIKGIDYREVLNQLVGENIELV